MKVSSQVGGMSFRTRPRMIGVTDTWQTTVERPRDIGHLMNVFGAVNNCGSSSTCCEMSRRGLSDMAYSSFASFYGISIYKSDAAEG
jgi:hypothetical protein